MTNADIHVFKTRKGFWGARITFAAGEHFYTDAVYSTARYALLEVTRFICPSCNNKKKLDEKFCRGDHCALDIRGVK